MTYRILILGGTTESRLLAAQLNQDSKFSLLLSLAGRTKNPLEQPVPTRIGGFGGAKGLADFLQSERFHLLIDATHPFADRISNNAIQASQISKIPLVSFQRPEWFHEKGDHWIHVSSITEAVQFIGHRPRKVFLALGRKELLPFEVAPQHHYIIRSVDPISPPLNVPNAHYILDRGPFDKEQDANLFQHHNIDYIISKNSGGAASYGKIAAARDLNIPVIIISRPHIPSMEPVHNLNDVITLCHHYLP